MIGEIFYWAINLSVLGNLCGIVLLCIRKIKVMPKFAVYLLWSIVGLRLCLPFGVANKYSLLSFISKITTKTVPVDIVGIDLSFSNFIMGADSYFPIKYKTDLIEKVFEIGGMVWLIVATAFILTSTVLYVLTKSEIKNATHIKDNIYKSDKIESPAVYGVFRPKIILPSKVMGGDIGYVLMHENVHIKRRDNLWRVVGVVITCLHWFNPLSWIMLKRFLEDMELACDSTALKNITEPKEYAKAILSVSQGKAFFASAFGNAKTRVRIENVLSYKKLTFISALATVIFTISIIFTLMTNAV